MNRFLLFAILSIFSILVQAQNHIGFKAGISYSNTYLPYNITATDVIKRGYLPGLQLGIPIEIKVNDLFYVQPELILGTEGSFLYVYRPEEQRIYNNVLLYLKLPLLGKVVLLKENNYQLNGLAGITPAYAIGIKSISYPQQPGVIREEPIDFPSSQTKRFDLALNLGMNIEKTIAKSIKMVLEIRYNVGLYDIAASTERTSFTESFYLTLGLFMPLRARKEKKETI